MRIKFIQYWIDIFKGKKVKPLIKNKGTDNLININKNDLDKFKSVIIDIEGSNNIVNISSTANRNSFGSINIRIKGSNCSINIDKGLNVTSSLQININNISETDTELMNTHVKIGKNAYIEQVLITTYQSNNTITIGNDCLFSADINLYNTDGHPIYDKNTNSLCNYVKNMVIGDNCWIGKGATILKNVELPTGTIVGWGSVVTKSIDIENCVIAGNPAKVVKKNVLWKRSGDVNSVKNNKNFNN